MPQLTEAEIFEALRPENVYERRKRIIQALDYEDWLLDRAVTLLETKLETGQMHVNDVVQIEDDIDDINRALDCVETAHTEMLDSLSTEQKIAYQEELV